MANLFGFSAPKFGQSGFSTNASATSNGTPNAKTSSFTFPSTFGGPASASTASPHPFGANANPFTATPAFSFSSTFTNPTTQFSRDDFDKCRTAASLTPQWREKVCDHSGLKRQCRISRLRRACQQDMNAFAEIVAVFPNAFTGHDICVSSASRTEFFEKHICAHSGMPAPCHVSKLRFAASNLESALELAYAYPVFSQSDACRSPEALTNHWMNNICDHTGQNGKTCFIQQFRSQGQPPLKTPDQQSAEFAAQEKAINEERERLQKEWQKVEEAAREKAAADQLRDAEKERLGKEKRAKAQKKKDDLEGAQKEMEAAEARERAQDAERERKEAFERQQRVARELRESLERSKQDQAERARLAQQGKAKAAANLAKQRREAEAKARSSFDKAWETYSRRWTLLEKKDRELVELLTFASIPWPVASPPKSPQNITRNDIKDFLMSPLHETSPNPTQSVVNGIDVRLREALFRFHPDKIGKYQSDFAFGEEEKILEGSRTVTMFLNELRAMQK